MRVVVQEFESGSSEVDYYDFQSCILTNIKTEPFFLRHEYYDNDKDLKQSLSLFTRKTEERGAQVFIDLYRDYAKNIKYGEDLLFYEEHRRNIKISSKNEVGPINLLPKIKGEVSYAQFSIRDGKYRRRIVYDIKGKNDAILLVFSIDSEKFAENCLFNFVKDNVQLGLD